MVTRAERADAPLDSPQRILDEIGRKREHRALVATAGRMGNTVLVVGREHQRRVRVDESGLTPSFDEEDTSARKADLGDRVEHERPVVRAGRSADDVVYAGERALEKHAR